MDPDPSRAIWVEAILERKQELLERARENTDG